ncbi:hypothetical protein TIFTF001_012381 [Ficus carica]|uniref:Uncharacterized protein n=1 Tax=Ficus carica TaxID=3494 RepID=A0AA88DI23_FICCA|nr:hypothetical protein TIFTF001_012381 [Ficus carica]
MMASKLSRVVPTCHEGGFGPWFEFDWTGRPLTPWLRTTVSNLSTILDSRRWGLTWLVVKLGMETATHFVILYCYL